MDAEGFGIVEGMGALKLSESSSIVTIQILKICTAQARQQSPHIDTKFHSDMKTEGDPPRPQPPPPRPPPTASAPRPQSG